MCSSNCCFLTCIQISQEAGKVVWSFHLFKNVPQFVVIHTVNGFSIVNKAEVDVSLELRQFFDAPTDVNIVKAMVLPVVMYGCESWIVKKAESRRIDAFELWCWRRLMSPLDCKEIQPVHSEDQPWDFFGGNDAEAEIPVLWPPHAKS